MHNVELPVSVERASAWVINPFGRSRWASALGVLNPLGGVEIDGDTVSLAGVNWPKAKVTATSSGCRVSWNPTKDIDAGRALSLLEGLVVGPPEGQPGLVAVHEDLIVLDKPAGWVVHPALDDEEFDLQAWVGGLNPAHRIDRGTSGLVVYAREGYDPSASFASGLIEKAYLALVYGRPQPKGIIRRKLSDARRGKPLEAVTRYRTVAKLGPVSYVRVRPSTGRKHQIRRHLEGLGHPVVGDTRYRGRGIKVLEGAPDRLWLHAGQLTLPDGRSFEVPLPPSLAAHLESLRVLE
jgi:16S rRNA U516 pseudouridylate synthase RsuA-like enzyme